MLMLSRHPGEEIVIDGGITLTVVSVQGDRVRLGITAPRDVSVDRKEVSLRRAEFEGEPRRAGEPRRVSGRVPALEGGVS